MKSNYFLSLSLEEQNKLLESILDALPYVVFLYDVEERKNLFINNAVFENIGYTIEEIHSLGDKVLQEIIHPDDYEEIIDLFQKNIVSKEDSTHIHLNRWKDKQGKYHWFKNHVTPFYKSKLNNSNKVILTMSNNITPQVTSQSMILKQIKNVEKISFT